MALVKRGAQPVAYGGCADCHTPMKSGSQGLERDLERGLSGHPAGLTLPPPPTLTNGWVWSGAASMTAFAGPWGITFASNLTPDRETGIGSWKEADFIRALRSDVRHGSQRPIPPTASRQNGTGRSGG